MKNLIAEDVIRQFKFFGRYFYVQWHITSNCTENCVHCYLDKSMDDVFDNWELCKDVINQIADIAHEKNKVAYIALTGGDPLLHTNIEELIKFSISKGIHILIKGTPWLLTDEKAKRLKELGVERYNLSLDGLEKTHDSIRQNGSFRKTIESISDLKRNNIEVAIKFTVSATNYKEMSQLLKYVSKSEADIFDYQRYAPGSCADEKYMIDKNEYRELLLELMNSYSELKENGSNLVMTFRDHLWILLAKELGILDDNFLKYLSPDKRAISGCTMANNNSIVINANGDILPCAKVPDYVLGNVTVDNLSQSLQSQKFIALGNINNYKKCAKCKLGALCRGCPAVSYYRNKDVFDSDLQCWLELEDEKTS